MTSLDGSQTPKTRALAQNRSALVASLDIGNVENRLHDCAAEAVRAE